MHSGLAFVSPRLDSIMMIEDLGTHSIHGLTSGDLRRYYKRLIPLQQILLYLTIMSAFTGTLVMSVEIGPIHLFPYRFLLLFMWVFIVVSIFMNNGRLKLSHVKVQRYLQFLVLWLSYAFISMMWAAKKGEALRNIIFLFTGVSVVFFLVYYFRNLNYLKGLYWLLLLIFIALLPVGIWEVTTGNHLEVAGLFEDTRERFAFMPSAVFHNPNDYAAYIALTLPMFLVWVRYYPKVVGRVFGILIMIVGLWILIMTFSRSCYIAVLMGFAFWFMFLLPWKKKIKTLVLMSFLCTLLVVAFPTQFLNILAKVAAQANSLTHLVLQDEKYLYTDTRLNLIKNGLFFTVKSLGFGVGAGNGDYYMANYAIYPVGEVTNMHNWWMEILLNYGVFIFVGYVISYISILLNLWRLYKRVDDVTERIICEALLVSWVSFFMASISSSSIMGFPPQWIYLGFILAFLNYSRIKKLHKTLDAYPD
jgi:teichuronic acid biosynthesis protein TuaE